MSYKEKIAWLHLVTMVLCFGSYFVYIYENPGFYDLPYLDRFKPLSLAGVTNALVVILGHIALRLNTPKDERIATDERDLTIAHGAMKIAYQLLIYLVLLVGCILPFYLSGWKLVNVTLMCVVAAETFRGLNVVLNYRKF